jgi:chemotaxis protein CheC
MSINAIGLSELELDALTELVNLGVSSSANSLREMVKEEVVLSVPKVTVVSRLQAIANLKEHGLKRLVAVQQDFQGDFNGRALLIFPEAKSMELVRAVAGGELSVEEITELEQEALAETGNVLLNGCLGTMANNLQRSLKISLPEVIYDEGAELFNQDADTKGGDGVLFIYINFAFRYRDVEGFIAMLLDMQSLMVLKELIGAFIERASGQKQPV